MTLADNTSLPAEPVAPRKSPWRHLVWAPGILGSLPLAVSYLPNLFGEMKMNQIVNDPLVNRGLVYLSCVLMGCVGTAVVAMTAKVPGSLLAQLGDRWRRLGVAKQEKRARADADKVRVMLARHGINLPTNQENPHGSGATPKLFRVKQGVRVGASGSMVNGQQIKPGDVIVWERDNSPGISFQALNGNSIAYENVEPILNV